MASPTTQRNPYIVGPPIRKPESFFGRESLFKFIEDNLNQDGTKVILLHGQRRIGKSSVLCQIPNFVAGDEFFFVIFDLQNKAQLSLSEVLNKLARKIIDTLPLPPDSIQCPSITELETDPDIFSRQLLPQVFQVLASKQLVLLLDEFDVLNNHNPDSAAKHLFPYLQDLIEQHKQLLLIPVIGRQPGDLENLLSLFKDAPNQRIGLLDEPSAKQLITKPAEGVLEYTSEAIQGILELSAGHPYFTQALCSVLFRQARDTKNSKVTYPDIEKIVEKAIEIAEGGLAWFRDGLPIPERVLFSAVAEAQEIISQANQFVEEPLKLLKESGIVQTEQLVRASDRLVEWGFLNSVKGSELPQEQRKYKVTVELVRRWLVKRYPLQREIWELENLEDEVHPIYEKAVKMSQDSKNWNAAIELYKQVLQANPNHFNALFKMADVYGKVEKFSKAVELYQRAYQVDPILTQEGFVRSLLSYGDNLMEKRKFELAKQQFNRVLEIEPENASAKQKLKEIKQLNKQVLLLNWLNCLSTLLGITGITTVLVVFTTLLLRPRLSTYKNPEQGIKIDYPKNWATQEIEDVVVGDVAVFLSPKEDDSDTFQENVLISVVDLPSNSSSEKRALEKYTDESVEQIKNNLSDDSSVDLKETTLANLRAIEVTFKAKDIEGNDLKRRQLWTLKNDRAYIITYNTKLDKYSELKKPAREIINSFEIID